eukprot:scaffold100162_cov35-Tisochrysis_lutea.AAC.1
MLFAYRCRPTATLDTRRRPSRCLFTSQVGTQHSSNTYPPSSAHAAAPPPSGKTTCGVVPRNADLPSCKLCLNRSQSLPRALSPWRSTASGSRDESCP